MQPPTPPEFNVDLLSGGVILQIWAFLIPMRALHFARVSVTTLNSGGGGLTAQLFSMGVYF